MRKHHVCLMATCRNPELIRGTTLVFDTLRVGFPTATIDVYVNPMHQQAKAEVLSCARKVDANVHECNYPGHHDWIRAMIESRTDPFFICDGDIAFWDLFEQFDFEGQGVALAGRYQRQFLNKYAQAIMRDRLGTSLLWLSPERIRAGIAAQGKQFPSVPVMPLPDLAQMVNPRFFPFRALPDGPAKWVLDDACSALYHALGGLHFVTDHLDCYDHLNCSTYVDLAAPAVSDGGMLERHSKMFENPRLAKGIWRAQEAYFQHHAV